MQKKAGIITHHDVHNHGAQLQLFALTKVLYGLGYDAKALRYTKNYDFYEENISRKYNISLASASIYAKYLCKQGINKTLYNVKKRSILNNFRSQNNLVGEYYSHAKGLDAVVIGSDEIFSIESGLNPCFWGMGVPCDKIISYAASFGSTTQDYIKDKHAEEYIKAGIQCLSLISVRDENSKKIVEHLSSRSPQIVCDPVILYGFADEIKKAREEKGKGEKYIAVYSYDSTMNDPETVRAVRDYAKKQGCKIYSIGFYHKWCDRNVNVDPLEIFRWFINAECVITDTFHGAVISIITHSQMYVRLKETSKNKLLWLLKEYELTDRIIEDFSKLDLLSKSEIDFATVNKIVEEKRNSSLNYLRGAMLNND